MLQDVTALICNPVTEVLSSGPCDMIKSHYNLSNTGHSEWAEMHRHHGLVLMLLDMKGKFTIWKANISRLSYNLVAILLILSGMKSRSR